MRFLDIVFYESYKHQESQSICIFVNYMSQNVLNNLLQNVILIMYCLLDNSLAKISIVDGVLQNYSVKTLNVFKVNIK